ncbi:MAG: TolC family protein [Deferrisomatales bacterium]
MKRATLSLVLLALLTAAPAPPAAALTLDAAVAEALRRNHEVLRAREGLSARLGRVDEARSPLYPQVNLEGSYRRSLDESVLDSFSGFIEPEATHNYGLRTTASHLLFSWGRVSTAVEVAVDGLTQGRHQVASSERRLKLEVHEAFYGLLLARRLVEVAEERLAQRERHLDVARKRFEAGVVNEFEVVRARVDVANARTPVILARNRVRQAQARLNNLLARPQDTPLEPDGQLERVRLPLTLEGTVERAVERRPELAALRVGREIAEKNLRIARAEDKPRVSLQGEYGFATQEFEHLNPSRERWGVGLVASMPLFDGWRTQALVAQAVSGVRDVELAADQLRQAIYLEAKVALDALEEAEEIIEASSLNIDQAEQALRLAETSYRYGVATALDVGDAELGLTAARTDHARALHDHQVARARVRSVMDDL